MYLSGLKLGEMKVDLKYGKIADCHDDKIKPWRKCVPRLGVNWLAKAPLLFGHGPGTRAVNKNNDLSIYFPMRHFLRLGFSLSLKE